MIDMPASAALRRIHRVALGDLVHRSALKFPERTAIVDGATPWIIITQVFLPLLWPAMVTTGLLAFIGAFNDFVLANTVLSGRANWTLAIGMNQWVGGNERSWEWFAPGALIAAVPILLLFLFLQRYIVAGLTGGSVKG